MQGKIQRDTWHCRIPYHPWTQEERAGWKNVQKWEVLEGDFESWNPFFLHFLPSVLWIGCLKKMTQLFVCDKCIFWVFHKVHGLKHDKSLNVKEKLHLQRKSVNPSFFFLEKKIPFPFQSFSFSKWNTSTKMRLYFVICKKPVWSPQGSFLIREKQDLHERISDKRVSGGVPPSGKTISHCRTQSHAFGKKAHVWLKSVKRAEPEVWTKARASREKRASTHTHHTLFESPVRAIKRENRVCFGSYKRPPSCGATLSLWSSEWETKFSIPHRCSKKAIKKCAIFHQDR